MLYPAIQPAKTWRFPVSGLHTLYLEECGSADGVPVVFLHGGPGGACEPGHRRFFDPEAYRIILFDQRGSGKSRPHANLEDNTTWDLIADLEKIREHLGIEKWVLFGGSWGSTLALAYAQTHPDRVLGLILRGIFLARNQDVHWFFQGEASRIFPEAWAHFVDPIPETERGDIIGAYYRRLTSENEFVCMAAAKAWSIWEGSSVTLLPNKNVVEHFSDPHVALSIARIECHYFKHGCFFRSNQLLEDMSKINHLPGFIVHGRYDMVCPIDQAFALKSRWEAVQLRIIDDAGHAVTEPGISNALVECCNSMLEMIG